jgi:hypothetical protein
MVGRNGSQRRKPLRVTTSALSHTMGISFALLPYLRVWVPFLEPAHFEDATTSLSLSLEIARNYDKFDQLDRRPRHAPHVQSRKFAGANSKWCTMSPVSVSRMPCLFPGVNVPRVQWPGHVPFNDKSLSLRMACTRL